MKKNFKSLAQLIKGSSRYELKQIEMIVAKDGITLYSLNSNTFGAIEIAAAAEAFGFSCYAAQQMINLEMKTVIDIY